MRSKAWHRLTFLVLAMIACAADAYQDYGGKTVGSLQGFYDGADCIFFTLKGVAEADPINPGSNWFAISRSQYGAKDALAVLLAAKVSGQTVHVTTRGNMVCGYAGVMNIILE